VPDFLVRDRLSGTFGAYPEPNSRARQSIGYVNEAVSAELILIRALVGTVSIEHCPTGTTWNPTQVFAILGCPSSPVSQRQELVEFFEQKLAIDAAALDSALRRNLRHEGFYLDLVGELLHYLWRSEQGRHTLAFIHIYRYLERISFAFPMLYAARTSDFRSAYTSIQQYFGGASDKGELAFFRKFQETSIEEQLRSARVRLDLSQVPNELQSRTYQLLRRFLSDEFISEQPDSYIEIECRSILGLLINLRNRFFHFNSNHDNNITALDLADSDLLYSVVNDIFLNWLGVIQIEILRHRLH
jgi:hypothetical protein